jgi:two-component system NarL family sensor kinase
LIVCGYLHGQSSIYIIGEFPSVFSAVENQVKDGEIDSVLVICDQILNGNDDENIRGIAVFYKGQAEELKQQNLQFEIYYQDAINIFKATNFEKGLAMAYCKLADFYFFQNDLSNANTHYNLSINYAKKLALHQVIIDAYEKKAAISTFKQDPESSIEFLKTALFSADLENYQEQNKDILNQIATTYHSIGGLDSAIFYFQRGLRLKDKMEDADGLVSDLVALGNLYRERGDYEEAQRHLMDALEIAETEKDTFSISTIYSELGDIYTAQNMWDVAEEYYSKAMILARLKNSRFAEAGCYKKMGYIYQQQKKDSAAIESYEAALKIYSQLNNKINEADIIMSLSQVYKGGNQFAKAKQILLEALQSRNKSQDLLSILSIKMSLAEIEVNQGFPHKGIAYAEECLPSYQAMDDKEGLRDVYALLSDAYAKKGDFKSAYKVYLNYSEVNDSLTSIDRAKAIKKYDLLYSTEKKDKEIAQQKVEIEKQKVDIQRRNNQLLMLGGGLALIGLFASFLIFVNRKNKQLNKQKIEVLKKEQETEGLKSFIDGEEKERKRIARELHDGLGAVLATVKMQISSIQHKVPEIQSMETFQKAESLIDNACRTVREISHNLMPQVLEQEGLEFALEELCQTFSNQNGIPFEFNYFGKEQNLTQEIKTTVFRIAQELLKNIIKHAEAKEVIVQLTIEEDEIILIVEDDGKGFDVAGQYKGIGLQNIRSRTTYFNGTVEIESTPGKGSTFTILLPIEKNIKGNL